MNIESLKEGFDTIKVKHYIGTATPHYGPDAYWATHAALVKGKSVYVGVAKCAPADQFNRKVGVQIALGRALHAWKESTGVIPIRGVPHLNFSFDTKDEKEIHDLLSEYVFGGPLKDVECNGSSCPSYECAECKCPAPNEAK